MDDTNFGQRRLIMQHPYAMNATLNPTFLCSKTGVYRGIQFFHIFDPKHKLCVLVRTVSAITINVLSKKKIKIHV